MTNYEKLRERPDETIDEVAVGMLVARITEDMDRKFFRTPKAKDYYILLYKAIKYWLNSEVEE